jgi:K+ transport systems, NAD-binding component
MNFIIAGLSSIGISLAELLRKEGKDVVALDSDQAKCDELAESSDVMVIVGDITKKSVLEGAGGRNADALIALTNDDSDNLMACMLAKEMGTKKVISILNDIVHAEAFKEAGIDVQVKPDSVVAKHIYHTVLQPYIKDFLAINRAELFEVEAEAEMKCIGKKISEIETPRGVKLIWLERGGKVLNEDVKIAPEDRLILIVGGESSKRGADFMNKWFKG